MSRPSMSVFLMFNPASLTFRRVYPLKARLRSEAKRCSV
jgi:hypothetical protein